MLDNNYKKNSQIKSNAYYEDIINARELRDRIDKIKFDEKLGFKNNEIRGCIQNRVSEILKDYGIYYIDDIDNTKVDIEIRANNDNKIKRAVTKDASKLFEYSIHMEDIK